MALAKYDLCRQIEKLEARIKAVEEMLVVGWIARMGKCHRLRQLKKELHQLRLVRDSQK